MDKVFDECKEISRLLFENRFDKALEMADQR